jgi:hypothetical protein
MLAEVVSEELNLTDDNESVRFSIRMFPIEFWARLDESARLRSENSFLKSLTEGEYISSSNKCINGALGTWCNDHLQIFLMKDDCINALLRKLDSSKTEQDYVFQYFGFALVDTINEMQGTELANRAIKMLDRHVKAGDTRFHNLAWYAVEVCGGFWKDSLKESVDSFQAVEPTLEDSSENLPFDS